MVVQLESQEELERQEAVAEAAHALGLLRMYEVRIHYAKREVDTFQAEAANIEEATEKAWDYCTYNIKNSESEGDEIAYISEEDHPEDEIDVDLRAEGEPFSWESVDFVKALAKAEVTDGLQHWISKAQALLKK